MRICILSVVELKHMVMLSMYTDYFDRNNIKYDLIYMDRYHANEATNANNVYRYEINGSSTVGKIIGYYKFLLYAKRIIERNKYDFIITWNEYTAVLFESYLNKCYKNHYIVNIRDLFDPDDKIRRPEWLYPILEDAINGSIFTTVSSIKYLDYLPKSEKYVFVHSLNSNIMPAPVEHNNKGLTNPIIIMYIGKIGYLEEVEKLLKAFGNDERYLMKFVGIGSDNVKALAEKMGVFNVDFVGKFESKLTNDFLKEADVIFNLYGDKKACEQTALSNKLYYAVCLHVPILVYKNTYMNEMASLCGIAFPFDDYDICDVSDSFYSWYTGLKWDEIDLKCETFKDNALRSKLLFENRLDKVIKKRE